MSDVFTGEKYYKVDESAVGMSAYTHAFVDWLSESLREEEAKSERLQQELQDANARAMVAMKQIEHVKNLVERLEEWIEGHDDLSEIPRASFTWTTEYECVSIGDIVVWDTEDIGDDSYFPSLESCIDEFRQPAARRSS